MPGVGRATLDMVGLVIEYASTFALGLDRYLKKYLLLNYATLWSLAGWLLLALIYKILFRFLFFSN
jgi:hypothetical protein